MHACKWIVPVLVAGVMTLSPNPAAQSSPKEAEPALEVLPWVERATRTGRFTSVEKELQGLLREPDGIADTPPEIALEILRRIRLDYSFTPAAMLAQIQRDIPDATETDLERWRTEGGLQHRTIDDQVRYFSREPSNLYRFCEEARKRRDQRRTPKPDAESRPSFVLTEHLAEWVRLGEASERPEVYPVRHAVTYRVTIQPRHRLLKTGSIVRCWLPFPQEYRQQKDARLVRAAPGQPVLAPNGHPQRTLYLEQRIEDITAPIEFLEEVEFTTYAYYPHLDPAQVRPYDVANAGYLENVAERPPHIVFTPAIRETVESVVGDETNPLQKGRKIFEWVCRNVRYAAEVEYSTIPNLSDKALVSRRGDCGVQGMLFITMCRCAGIPARWQSGWETKPSGRNMHDWTEFYVEPWGWLPADPSYGLQEHPDARVREFYYGHMDPYRLIVNLDYARDLTPPKISFRSEPNDFQRGEIEIDGRNLYFNEWDWTFEVRTEPLEAFGAAKPSSRGT